MKDKKKEQEIEQAYLKPTKEQQLQMLTIKKETKDYNEQEMKLIRDYYMAHTQKAIYDNSFLRIPRAVVNKNISIQAKYLYGFIYGFIAQGGTRASNAYICDFLNCSQNSLAKYITELKKAECIRIEITDKNKRTIYPLISEGIQLISDNEMIDYFLEYFEYDQNQHERQQALNAFIKRMK